MANSYDDILFRIGFLEHPESQSQLDALAKAVEATQNRISASMGAFANDVTSTVETIRSQAEKAFGESVGRNPAVTTDRTNAPSRNSGELLEVLRQQMEAEKSLASTSAEASKSRADGAKSVKDVYEETLALLDRLKQAESKSPPGQSSPGANLVPINRSEVEQIYREDLRMREELEKAEQRHTASSRELSGIRSTMMQEEASIIAEARQMILEDMELINKANSAGSPSAAGVSAEEVNAARERVSRVYEHEMALLGQTRRQRAEAAREQGLAVQAEIQAQRKAEEEARAALQRRLELYKKDKAELERVAQAAIREREKQAKAAESARIREEKAAERAAKTEMRLLEKSNREFERRREQLAKKTETVAKQMAEASIRQYNDEVKAAEKANGQIEQSRGKLLEAFQGGAESVGKLGRSIVLLGIAEADELKGALQALAKVQAAIDLTTGTIGLLKNLGNAFSAIRTITVATAMAKSAEAKAGDIATASSGRLKLALDLEALSAQNAARAHAMLAAARAGKGGAVANVAGQAAQTAATSAATRVGASAATRAAGSVGGAAATAGAGKLFGGGIVGQGLSAAGAGGLGGIAILGAAATAAAAGLALAGKGAYDYAMAVKNTGEFFNQGAKADSFAEKVGGSNFNPFSWLMAADLKFQAMADAEKTKRVALAGQILAIEIQRNKKLQDIELSMVAQREKMRSALEFEFTQERIANMRDPAKRAEAQAADVVSRRESVTTAGQALNQFMETDAATGQQRFNSEMPGAEAAFQAYEQANEQLIQSIGARGQAEKAANDAAREGLANQIQGIQDVIRARQAEKKQLEDSLKSAKERFGELSAAEQAATIRAVEKARRGEDLSNKELARIERVGDAETKRLASEQKMRNADRGGFDAAFGREEQKGISEREKAINQGIDEVSNISGVDREVIAAKAAQVNVELVDRSQIDLKLNINEEALFNAIAEEIRAAKQEMQVRLEARLRDEANRQSAETTQAAANQIEAVNAGR